MLSGIFNGRGDFDKIGMKSTTMNPNPNINVINNFFELPELYCSFDIIRRSVSAKT